MSHVTVSLMVRNQDANKATALLEENYIYFDKAEVDSDFTEYQIHERRNGDIEQERDLLIDAGIPFDYSWDGCHSFNAGTGSVRFAADATVLVKNMHEEHVAFVEADTILKMLNESPADIDAIKRHLQERIDHHKTPDWELQDEYAQAFLAAEQENRKVHILY